MNRLHTNKITFWGLVFLLLIFMETVFFHNGNFVFVLLGAGLTYYGSRRRSKWMVVLGLFFIAMALFTLWSLRLLIFTLIIYTLIKLWKGVPSEEIMRPLKEFQKETPNGIWQNKLFSVQSSPFSSYEWEDIHIQGLFGDLHIDVTDTVLPKGTSLISIRQGVGKIKIDLPYEIPVRIHYTTLLGDARLFDTHRKRLINESLHMKDSYEGKSADSPELIITLATWAGDVEVTRK
ncbi:cell wall-active antibiotics response protein LiaF [Sporosarcina sp. FSL K6-1522]|uniref:cell wall-active antibiotics response protein LiaF n=1 Tax=Sporosarcina sp. FSL K6-1522 TaxID=2921554 RepID=UPI00315ACF49